MKLSINNPCNERYSSMKPVSNVSRHCEKCSKEILDLTTLEDADLIDIIQQKKQLGDKVCGRLSKSQLDRVLIPSQTISFLKKFAWALLLVFGAALFKMNNVQASMVKMAQIELVEDSTKSAKIVGELYEELTGEPLAFANVVFSLNGEVIGGTTSDFDGKYSYELDAKYIGSEIDVRISFIGYKSIDGAFRMQDTATLDMGRITFQEEDMPILGMIIMTTDENVIDSEPDAHRKTKITKEDLRRMPRR